MDKRILTVATVVIALVALCVCLPSSSEAVTTADDLQYAVSSAPDNTETTIALENDIILEQTLSIPAGKVIILDLAGHRLSIGSGFVIEVLGNLTINDSEGGSNVSTGAGVTVITRAGSDLTINGGSYTTNGLVKSYSRALEVQGNATITAGSFATTAFTATGTNYTNAISVIGNSDGTSQAALLINPADNSDVVVSSMNDYALTVRYGAEATINGGTFTGSSNYQDLYNLDFPEGGSITVTGGSFSGVVQSQYMAEGYACVPQADRYIVQESSSTNEITVDSYDKLADALDGELGTTDVITIISNITIPAGVKLTLDFPDTLTIQNGSTLTVLGILTVNGYLYVDGTLTVADRGFIENPLNVTIGLGSITGFPDGDSFTVMTPMDLQWLSLANEIDTIPSYIELGADIDLSGYTYTSIGREGKEVFNIEFKGNGHTISNMNQDSGTQDAGLFGDIFDSVISDVTIELSSLRTSSGYGGFLAAMIGGDTTVTSVHIVDCQLNSTGSYGNGGFTGGVWCQGEESLEFIGCSISGSTINGFANTGGFWGTSSDNTGTIGIYNTSMSGTTVSSSKVNAGILGGFGNTAHVEAIGVDIDMNSITVSVNNAIQDPPLLVSSSDTYIDDEDLGSTAVKDSGGNWVAMGNNESIVAMNGGTPYASLNAAVADAEAGDVITLVSDVTEGIIIPAGSDIILDLKGHTIRNVVTAESQGSVKGDHTISVSAGASLTVKDSVGTGVIDCLSHGKAAIYNLGTFVLESGTLTRSAEASKSPTDNGGNSWYVVFNGGDMTFNGGRVYQDGYLSSLVINRPVNGSSVSMTINDGSFEQPNFIVIKNEDPCELEITSGTFVGTNEQALQNWGFATISDGVFEGMITSITYGNGTGASESTMDITGGSFTGDIVAWNYHEDGTPADNAAMITISGDAFVDGDLELWSGTAQQETDTDPASILVSGGTFTTDVSEYCADGLVTINNGNGEYIAQSGFTVTFNVDGVETVVRVPSGSPVLSGSIPVLPNIAGFEYVWMTDGSEWDPSSDVIGNMEIIAERSLILAVSIAVGDDGSTLVAMPYCLAQDVQYAYQWTKDGVAIGSATDVSITVTGPGVYAVIVTATADGVTGTSVVELSYRPTVTDPEEDVPEFDITHDGDSAEATTGSDAIVITSDGEHDDVSLDVTFIDGSDKVAGISINGTVSEGGVTISANPIGMDNLFEYASGLEYVGLGGVDVSLTKVSGFQMIIKVPFTSNGSNYVGAADAYYIDNGDLVPVTCRVMGEEVWIYTDHNTPYMVVVTEFAESPVYEDDPTVDPEPELPPIPFPGDDDDYVPIPPVIVQEDSGDDNTKTVAACAAAAVAAAILAILLASLYRRK